MLAAFVAAAPTSSLRAMGDAAGPLVVVVDEGDVPTFELFLIAVEEGVELLPLSAGAGELGLLEGDATRAVAVEGRVELIPLVPAAPGDATRAGAAAVESFVRPRNGCLVVVVVLAAAGGAAAAGCSLAS